MNAYSVYIINSFKYDTNYIELKPKSFKNFRLAIDYLKSLVQSTPIESEGYGVLP
jgi:hypothetical protein